MESLENVRLNTEKLHMTPANVDFAEDIFYALNDEITKFLSFPTPKSIDETIEFLQENEDNIRAGKSITFAALRRDNDEFVWNCWIEDITTGRPKLWMRVALEQGWNKFGTDMVRALIRWYFEKYNNDFMIYQVDENNRPSVHIARNKIDAECVRGPFEQEQEKDTWNILKILEYRVYGPERI